MNTFQNPFVAQSTSSCGTVTVTESDDGGDGGNGGDGEEPLLGGISPVVAALVVLVLLAAVYISSEDR